MRFLNELHEGDRISGIYLCKQKQPAVTKNGKPYENIILQDKTGMMDGKIWDPNSLGIDDFDALDYIDVVGDVTSFAGAMQLNIKRVRKAAEDEYDHGKCGYFPFHILLIVFLRICQRNKVSKCPGDYVIFSLKSTISFLCTVKYSGNISGNRRFLCYY